MIIFCIFVKIKADRTSGRFFGKSVKIKAGDITPGIKKEFVVKPNTPTPKCTHFKITFLVRILDLNDISGIF